MDNHESYIRKCFELALNGAYHASPNPLVGALIVKNNKILSEGFHFKRGEDHAEVNAIKKLADLSLAKGATLYCNLEPCCHTDKLTPPCSDLIIKSGIKKVVIANLDSNPAVAGRGVEKLQAAGIEVIVGILEDEGSKLNEAFFKRIKTGKPFVHLKWAQSLDGKIALNDGQSKWITNQTSRQISHQIRLKSDAIISCAGTVRADNPVLSARYLDWPEKNIPRFIVSNSGNLNKDLNIFSHKPELTTILSSNSNVSDDQYGLSKHQFFNSASKIKPISIIEYLSENFDFNQIMIEAGSTLTSLFLQAGLFDRISVFIAPKLLGGSKGISDSYALDKLENCYKFKQVEWNNLQGDLYFTALKG
jgi:diaminohydroxyphosphoribosylaminopyrimidine deaminase/5-amino-6-(5-phosphoribosylamino)uracil reductase